MSKVDIKTLANISSNPSTATAEINDNFQSIQTAIENTVSRDGTPPNTMEASLDMNSNRIINLPEPVDNTDPVRKIDLGTAVEDSAAYATAAAASAAASANSSATSQFHALQAAGSSSEAEGYAIAAETSNVEAEGWAEDARQSALSIGKELVVLYYNDTGATITKGTVLHPVGGTMVGDDLYVTVELADASKYETCQGTLFVANDDVLDGQTGQGQRFGKIIGLDTTSYGAGKQLWLSGTTPGALTTTVPQFPYYAISMGGTLNSDATDGEIFISITTGVEDTIYNAFDGSIRETFDFRVTSDGSTITGTISNPNVDNTDLTLLMSTGQHIFDVTTNGTVTLTAGTSTVPQMNYVYIPESTKLLTVNTTGFPTTEHCKVAVLYLKDAASTQTDGALRNQNTNDHIKTDDDNGHILHIAERLRTLNAEWASGTEAALTTDGTDVYVSATSGQVYQLHKQTFPAQDMSSGDDIHVVNDPTTPYRTTTNLNDITVDANGNSLNNKWFSIVVWGVANKTGEISHLMCNLPTGGYTISEENAINDANGYAVYDIPAEFKGVGFLIGRFVMRLSGGTFTYNAGDAYQDLRGFFPNNTAGNSGGGSGITTLLGLTDTPSSYVGNAGKILKVNSGETAMEFTDTFTRTELFNGSTTGGTITFSEGISNFDVLEINGGGSVRVIQFVTVETFDDGLPILINNSDDSTTYQVQITYASDTTATVSGSVNGMAIKSVMGIKL